MSENTCAVHDLVLDGMTERMDRISKGQSELKDLIIKAQKEYLHHIQATSDANRRAIDNLSVELKEEVEKFNERDREYLIRINDLKDRCTEMINQLKIKHAIYTGVGISLATAFTFAVHAINIFLK